MITAVLVDARNYDQVLPQITSEMQEAKVVGFDFETHDDDRHDGLNEFCGYDPTTRKKKSGKPLVFDFRRTTVCGASIHPEGSQHAYYFNTGHADADNRLSYRQLVDVLKLKPVAVPWVAHNGQFEIAVAKACLNYNLAPNIIDTLQMAVSAYGPDTYSQEAWWDASAGGITKLVPALLTASLDGVLNDQCTEFSPELNELIYKVLAKESSSEWSYNGLAGSLAYGYGLKKVVKSFFNYEMRTFEETLGDKAHMGQLTGEEVVDYGADDAYWAVRLFYRLLQFMQEHGGKPVVDVFLKQENPMVEVFADAKLGGFRSDKKAIDKQQGIERQTAASLVRELRGYVKELLPFPAEKNENLAKYDTWYAKNYQKYRDRITDWANLPDVADDFTEMSHVAGAVSNQWLEEQGKKKSAGPNFSHYMPVRTLIYDLIQEKPLVSKGKTESDGEARGKLITRMTRKGGKETAIKMIETINKMASVDQRMKLYITPYRRLIDPETDFMYPTISSLLATRRMAGQHPNGMQLAKRGESVFVRGYVKADNDDHVLVSIDWSGIELVEIGEFSGDREFIKAFGQLPHADLHSGSAADILAVEIEGMDIDKFKKLRAHNDWGDYADDVGIKVEKLKRIQQNLKYEVLLPNKAYGYWRTEIGKGANFNYWYSGWLATIGERMGWSQDQTAEATKRYRERFPEAEQWRVGIIENVTEDGYITMPDGHRYMRYEATSDWYLGWIRKFIGNDQNELLKNYHDVIRYMGSRIQKRAGNQSVNAYIQGTCATIAKRSILRIREHIQTNGLDARFVMPVHDELVYSVHRDIAAQFITDARNIMITHPDLFKHCALDASPSVGLSFVPWNNKTARTGQIELFEPEEELVGAERAGKRLDQSGYQEMVDWLFEERNRLAA